jgi:hypothetical protein
LTISKLLKSLQAQNINEHKSPHRLNISKRTKSENATTQLLQPEIFPISPLSSRLFTHMVASFVATTLFVALFGENGKQKSMMGNFLLDVKEGNNCSFPVAYPISLLR